MTQKQPTKTTKKLSKIAKRPTLPLIWREAAGLLRRKKIDPLTYQRAIREEWGN